MVERILYTDNLNIGYKNSIISSINIEASQSDFICIIGRNGVGKSTLLNTLSGLIKPVSGNIFYNGKNSIKLSLREKSVLLSYVPSRQEYLSNMSIYDLISLGRTPYTNIFDKKSITDNTIISKALYEFNLEQLKNRALYEVSDGERQRAMICRAIVQETPIILLDEPTAFLDYYAKQKLLYDLSLLSNEKNKCIIFSSHDIELVLKYAKTVWLIINNQIKSMSVEELKESDFLNEIINFNF